MDPSSGLAWLATSRASPPSAAEVEAQGRRMGRMRRSRGSELAHSPTKYLCTN